MTENGHPEDRAARRIQRLLQRRYAAEHSQAVIDVYRYNPAAVRIRIIDPDFRGKSIPQREDEVWRILESLPAEVVAEITVCLLIAPEERSRSIMNLEFDHPQPTP